MTGADYGYYRDDPYSRSSPRLSPARAGPLVNGETSNVTTSSTAK